MVWKIWALKILTQNFNIKVCDLDRKVLGIVGDIAE